MICDQVRAVFPDAQFVHGEEGGREIGKRPALPAGVVEIDLYRPCLLEAGFGQVKGKRR